jgi:hypothetical protein
MTPTENYKDIEVNGRKFRLNKLNARTGTYMLLKITKILPSILENIDFDKIKSEDFNFKDLNLTKTLSPIFDMDEKEFAYIQDNCLKTVEELLPGGPQVVLDNNDQWGVLNIEFDMALVINLTVQSLWFNLQGFFAGMPFNSIMSKLSSYLQDMKI